MFRISIYVLVLTVTVSTNVFSASFNCDKATTNIEKNICSDKNLSILDEQLALAYKRALSNTNNKEGLSYAQSHWLKLSRNPCEDKSCLEKEYVSRITWLNNAYLKTGNSNIDDVSGEYIRMFRGKPSNDGGDWLSLKETKDRFVSIKGESLWIGNIESGHVNVGDLDGISVLNGNNLYYEWGQCRLTITIGKDELDVIDHNLGCGGMNVEFSGLYRKKSN